MKTLIDRDMANLHSFIRGSLEGLFSELFLSDASFWNKCKFIAFNKFIAFYIFSCNI